MLITVQSLKVSLFSLPVSAHRNIRSLCKKKRPGQSANSSVPARLGGLWKRTERRRLDVSSIIHAPLRRCPPPGETESPFSFCISRLFSVSDKLPSLRVKLGPVTLAPSGRSERGNEPRRLWTPGLTFHSHFGS